jgi:hypothetical protein
MSVTRVLPPPQPRVCATKWHTQSEGTIAECLPVRNLILRGQLIITCDDEADVQHQP